MASPLVSGSTDKMMNTSSCKFLLCSLFSSPLWCFLSELHITELTEVFAFCAAIRLRVFSL